MQRFSRKSVRLLPSQEGTPVRTGVAATSVYGTTAIPSHAAAVALSQMSCAPYLECTVQVSLAVLWMAMLVLLGPQLTVNNHPL